MFDKIFENANQGYQKNIEIYKQKKLKEEEIIENYSAVQRIRMEADNSVWTTTKGMPEKTEVYSEELYNIIEDNGFAVIEYGKRLDSESFYDEYDAISEYYLVEKGDYRFIIKHLEDVDIEEGIFAVYDVVNKSTDEKIEFYVDLGCRNTGKELFEDFKLLITCDSKDEYMKRKFNKYFEIEKLLIEKGIKVLSSNYNFTTKRSHAYIQVHENAYIVIYSAWMDEIRMVVTNNKTWDVNSSNNINNIGYYVDYDENNIELLINIINEFIKHITGQYGFLEDGVYYNNSHIRKMYDSIFSKKDKDGHTPEIFNHYHVKIENISLWDCRGYGEPHYINVFNGLEIADHRKLILNDAAQWSIGNFVNISDIIFKYDKKIDPDKCILLIKNYQYDKTKEDFCWISDEEFIDEFSNDIDSEKYLVDTIEIHGDFSELIKYLYSYIIEICKKFNIDILKTDFVS